MLPHMGMSYMDPAAMLAALDVGHPAIEPPMANLVAEPAFFPEWALPIAVVSSICPALTTVPGSAHCDSALLLPHPIALTIVDARPLP